MRGVHENLAVLLRRRAAAALAPGVRWRARSPLAASSAAGDEFEREQPVPLERTGQLQSGGFLGRKAESAVIGRVADQDDRAMAEPARIAKRAPHQRGADAAVAAIRRDRDRPQQQSRLAAAAGDVPEPRGADHAPAVGGDEAQSLGRQAAVAQTLRGLAVAAAAEGLVEQRLARFDVGRPFLTQRDHFRSFPVRPRASARDRRRQFE